MTTDKNKYGCYVEIGTGCGDFPAVMLAYNPENKVYPYIAIDITHAQAWQICQALKRYCGERRKNKKDRRAA